MKSVFLKISGAKNDAEFYKKFPSEEAFMKVHGKEFKKAQNGWVSEYDPDPIDMSGFDDQFAQNQFSINKSRRRNINNAMQNGLGIMEPTNGFPDLTRISEGISAFAPGVGKIVQGIQGLKDEKKNLDKSVQMNKLSQITLDASRTRPEAIKRKYVRPEDNITTGEELFPVYGNAKKGKLLKAQFGNVNNGAQKLISDFITGVGGQNAGGDLGGGIGSTLGNILLPGVGGVVGQALGQTVGAIINRKPAKIKKNNEATMRNVNTMGAHTNFMGLQDQNFSYMENGGNLPEIQEDGQLAVHWGGKVEPVSFNPHLPGTGETVMFKGQSHNSSSKGRSGIGISYQNNPVEVEGGEPATVLNNGGDEGLVVFGNLKIPKGMETFIGDPKAKNKKFKNYVDLLSKEEAKVNKLMEKNMEDLEEIEPATSFDKLAINSRTANIKGADMKLKTIAGKKERTGELQTAMNDLQGDKKTAQDGTTIPTFGKIMGRDDSGLEIMNQAQYDYLTDLYKKAAKTGTGEEVEFFQKAYSQIAPNRAKNILNKTDATNFGKLHGFTNEQLESNYDGIFGYRTEQYLPVVDPQTGDFKTRELGPSQNRLGDVTDINDPGYRRSPLYDIAGQVMPFLRPSNRLPLDPDQLTGEMYALSQNQLDPVQAQTYRPELNTPYRVSFQDALNENNATFRGAESGTGYNPALQAMLASEKYKANQKILGEEFRTNQQIMDSTFRENRATLNDAQLKNLGIYDQQYVRQAQAKSNTKDTAQNALNSISRKILENRTENRTLGIYENMYNYRYDNRGRAINFNAPFMPNIPTVGTIPTDENGNEIVRDTTRETQRFDRFNVPQGKLKTKETRTTKKNKNGGLLKYVKSL